MSKSARGFVAMVLASVFGLILPVHAEELRTFTSKSSFEDVRFELSNAITGRGLVVDFNGNVGKMLERTGADVGSAKPLYRAAEYFSFCSAKLSRDMMEADPANVGLCPYVVFVYEKVSRPGEVIVGYRRLPKGATVASEQAYQAIDKLLEGIAQSAVK